MTSPYGAGPGSPGYAAMYGTGYGTSYGAGYAGAPGPSYYDPTNPYGAPNGVGYQNTPFTDYYQEQNPQAAYTRYLRQQGIPQFGTYGQWAQGQSQNAWNGYQASLVNNPFQTWAGQNGYLSGLNLQQLYAGLTPGERGVTPGWLIGGRAQWINR